MAKTYSAVTSSAHHSSVPHPLVLPPALGCVEPWGYLFSLSTTCDWSFCSGSSFLLFALLEMPLPSCCALPRLLGTLICFQQHRSRSWQCSQVKGRICWIEGRAGGWSKCQTGLRPAGADGWGDNGHSRSRRQLSAAWEGFVDHTFGGPVCLPWRQVYRRPFFRPEPRNCN